MTSSAARSLAPSVIPQDPGRAAGGSSCGGKLDRRDGTVGFFYTASRPSLLSPSNMNSPTRRLLSVSLILSVATAFAQKPPTPPVPKTTAELREQIEKVLKETHTPGVGVAIVKRDGPEWVAGIGLADVAAGKAVTPDTLFRIGSVSKGFVSLSLLKLQQEGKLSLQDTLRSRAPDLEFANPWEATDPVRIVNLLEHTSGWDDMALRDYAFDPVKEATLKEGLAFNPRTRTSRWRPGTRFSYSNSGPAAAAYVVEKVSGQRFEDYVEQTWFTPLGMKTAGYLDTPEVQSRLTKLYRKDGRTPYPYWHILLRPAGSINASAREMANYVQFYLNRGSFGGVQLLPPEAIDRMETPTSTYAAREGLKIGYGLGNYTTVRARIFHGHNGGVEGGLTELAYLPEDGVGYVFMINSGSGAALWQIDRLIRSYVVETLPKPRELPVAPVPAEMVRKYAGWYEPISPRTEISRGILRITGLTKLSPAKDGLSLGGLNGHKRNYVAVTDRTFRRPEEVAPTLALIADHSEGTLIDAYWQTFRRVPAWLPWVEAAVIAAAVLLMLSSVAFALVWVPRKILGHMRSVECLSVRTMPVLAALAMGCAQLLIALSMGDAIARLGRITPWSLGFFGSTLTFAVFALLGLVFALRCRNRQIRRWVWWHAFTASIVFTVVAVYLSYWGIIGLRTWA
jgi:CubicO group peptidase (beta-lactamase class C family)